MMLDFFSNFVQMYIVVVIGRVFDLEFWVVEQIEVLKGFNEKEVDIELDWFFLVVVVIEEVVIRIFRNIFDSEFLVIYIY